MTLWRDRNVCITIIIIIIQLLSPHLTSSQMSVISLEVIRPSVYQVKTDLNYGISGWQQTSVSKAVWSILGLQD